MLALQVLRLHDVHRAKNAWRSLARTVPPDAPRFDPAMVAGVPEPARRFFLFAIAPGATLHAAVELETAGELSLGNKQAPNYMPMRARQILAGPRGFVWMLKAGSGLMRMAGSDGYFDGEAWTRFWLLNVFPVARASGATDFARSAAGRAVAESVFWAPAALLPQAGVVWEAVNKDTARAHVPHGSNVHTVDVTVSADGRPASVLLQRWSRENPERAWRLQPFGGTIEEIIEVDGYRLAARVEGGNWFGTERYFPFYRSRVTRLRFLPSAVPNRH
jgi:hypothetical protein